MKMELILLEILLETNCFESTITCHCVTVNWLTSNARSFLFYMSNEKKLHLSNCQVILVTFDCLWRTPSCHCLYCKQSNLKNLQLKVQSSYSHRAVAERNLVKFRCQKLNDGFQSVHFEIYFIFTIPSPILVTWWTKKKITQYRWLSHFMVWMRAKFGEASSRKKNNRRKIREVNAFSFVRRKFIVRLAVVWIGRVTENGSQRRSKNVSAEER